jgi:hypothetical protein
MLFLKKQKQFKTGFMTGVKRTVKKNCFWQHKNSGKIKGKIVRSSLVPRLLGSNHGTYSL